MLPASPRVFIICARVPVAWTISFKFLEMLNLFHWPASQQIEQHNRYSWNRDRL